jgi:hypothetical protein
MAQPHRHDRPGLELPPLPPGSALRFSSPGEADKRFPSLLQNLEGEMSKLLEWASTGDTQQRRRSRVDPALGPHVTHTAEVRREEVRDFLKERNDVHQRRAKRREIAESTAVRLPREIQAGKLKRGGKDREISYLSDGGGAPHSSHVPASVIPDAFRIVMESPIPSREPHFYSMFGEEDNSTYNPATRQFETILFPSKVPAGRRDVLLLHAWVNDMIGRLKQTSSTLEEVRTRPRNAPTSAICAALTQPSRVCCAVLLLLLLLLLCVRARAGGYAQGRTAALLRRLSRDHPAGVSALPRARLSDGKNLVVRDGALPATATAPPA